RKDVRFIVSIANASIRRRITDLCEHSNLKPFTVKSNDSLILEGSKIGEGSILAPFSMVTANSTIGLAFHLNYYACVTHDCVIGDYVTFGPRAQCNGNVHIGDDVYIGAGALIKQGSTSKPLVIGKGATIGMGSVVIRDEPPGATVVGTTAKVIRQDPI